MAKGKKQKPKAEKTEADKANIAAVKQQLQQVKTKLGKLGSNNPGASIYGWRKGLRDPGNAYLLSLADPFREDSCTHIPDICTIKSACTQIRHNGSFITNSAGAGGVIMWLPATGQAGAKHESLSGKAGFAYYSETDSSNHNHYDYEGVYFPDQAITLFSEASAIRIVSAELRVEGVPTVTGANPVTGWGWYKDRFMADNPKSNDEVIAMCDHNRVPMSKGIRALYAPLDNNDFEYGKTDTNTTGNANLGVHVSAPAGTVFQYSMVVNVEFLCRNDRGMVKRTTSPVSPWFMAIMNVLSQIPKVVAGGQSVLTGVAGPGAAIANAVANLAKPSSTLVA